MDYLVIILLIAVVLLGYGQSKLNKKLQRQENALYVLRAQRSDLENNIVELLNTYQDEIDLTRGAYNSLNSGIDTINKQIKEEYETLHEYHKLINKKLEQMQDLIK